jgi:hypothetical protein
LKIFPNFPFCKISFGPVGQSVDIMYFFKKSASTKTFGEPSYFEDSKKISACFMYLNGLFLYPNNLMC